MQRVIWLLVGCLLAAGCAGPGTEFDPEGLSEEYATRIAKGIVGP
jgi:hypothetical protein